MSNFEITAIMAAPALGFLAAREATIWYHKRRVRRLVRAHEAKRREERADASRYADERRAERASLQSADDDKLRRLVYAELASTEYSETELRGYICASVLAVYVGHHGVHEVEAQYCWPNGSYAVSWS